MCGRFSLATTKEKLQKQLPFLEEIGEVKDNYNVAPTQHSYVVTDDQPQVLQAFKWGLVPFWAKDPKIGSKLINARMEGIEEKPAFRTAIRKRKCLVPADSFYEWKKTDGSKTPYRILLKNGNLICFAGIWETWDHEGQPLHSFSIITTQPNKEMASIHDRMPVVLHTSKLQQAWLAEQDLDKTLAMLESPPDGILEMYPISSLVNSPKNNSPELHEKAGEG
jgi:putative SOS response-associated peptidase YedK